MTAVHSENGFSEEQLLAFAALAEQYSDHPISLSLRAAWGQETDPRRVADVEELAGHGVIAVVDGHKICVGNHRLMERTQANWQPCDLSGTIVHVTIDGVYGGHIVISDLPKEDAAPALAALKQQGVRRTVMLTGDTEAAAKAVAEELGVDEYHAELLPADKVERVEQLLTQGSGKLVFVGDGINDAPVLTRADIGIAMGALGSDAAIEAADIVLMDDNPSKIAVAIRISRKTLRIVRQNIVFALGVKGLVLVLGALGLANMWLAVFADVGVAFLAILNAMRCLRAEKICPCKSGTDTIYFPWELICMLKKIYALLLALALSLSLTACSEDVTNAIVDEVVDVVAQEVLDALEEEDAAPEEAPDASTETPPQEETAPEVSEPVEDPAPEEEPAPEEAPAIAEDGFYTTKEDVALYIYTYGRLPDNFITKKEAESLGWKSGGLDDYA